MATAEKMKTFEVTRTPKLKDSAGDYVKRGEKCQLTKEQAEHYHKLGYIRVAMGQLFDDDEDADKRADARAEKRRLDALAASKKDDAGHSEQQSDDAADGDDAEEASDDAEDDAGTGETEAAPGHRSNRRRKRVTG